MVGAKMWSSMGDMLDGQDETDEKKKVNPKPFYGVPIIVFVEEGS